MARDIGSERTLEASGWAVINGSSPDHLPRYWEGTGWSTLSNDAVLYARRIDAERSLSTIAPDIHGRDHRIQHMTLRAGAL